MLTTPVAAIDGCVVFKSLPTFTFTTKFLIRQASAGRVIM